MRHVVAAKALVVLLTALLAGVLWSPPAPAHATGVTAIGAGGVHTCAVTANSQGLACWGDNSSGQLGSGTLGGLSSVPVGVLGLDAGVTAVGAGVIHTCALTSGGGVKCWGDGTLLGSGITTSSASPVDVVGLGSGIAAIFPGFLHTCALTLSGSLTCWGMNLAGELGADCGNQWCLSPLNVVTLQEPVLSAAAGRLFTCALLASGRVKCWGGNGYGQLGDGSTNDSPTPVDVLDDGGAPLDGIVAIAAGYWHVCALTTTGDVKCWGFNQGGQLGNGLSGLGAFGALATDVQGLDGDVEAISAGAAHTCALMADGAVKCWGENSVGQLGAPTNEMCPPIATVEDLAPCSTVPTAVLDLNDAQAIVAGAGHTCAVLSGGSARCWGFNGYGQLGNGTTIDSLTPVDVLFDSDEDACPDPREQGADPLLGGARNPKSFWDFFDTPDGANARDQAVTAGDIARVAGRFGAAGDAGIDPLSAPPASGYHTAFDRSPPAPGADVWDAGPPDGSIAAADIAAVVAQFGHSCA